MTTSRALVIGDRRVGAHIEYVKSRRVLRMEGWHGDRQRMTGIEVPLRAFLDQLDIDVPDMDAPGRYLLFAGQGRPGGGARDLSGVFGSEETARAAFHELRTTRRTSSSWAQLVSLDCRGRSKPLCWFEADAAALSPARTGQADQRTRRRRPWTRRWTRTSPLP